MSARLEDGKSCARVEAVAEGVADEVEGEDRKHDGECGEDDHVGGVKEVGAGFVEHGAPACGRRGDSEAKEAEGGFGEDGSGEADGGLHDDGLNDVGQDVDAEKAEIGCAESAGGLDELLLLDGEDLGADQAGVADPSGEGKSEDEVGKSRAEEGDEGDGDENAWESEERVGDVDVEDDVGEAAVEAGDGSGEDAKKKRESHHGEGDDERDAGAVEDAREDVASELIGAKGMSVRREHEAMVEVERGRAGGSKRRCEDGGKHEEQEQQDSG